MAMRGIDVIYDDECGLCRGLLRWARRWEAADRLRFVPWNSGERERLLPAVTWAEFQRGVHVRLPDGRVRVGADGLYELLRQLPGWRWLAPLYRVPGVRRLAQWWYGRLARGRRSCGFG